MANKQHSAMTDADGLHEPKGIAAASDKQLYIANGAGSGAWTTPTVASLVATGNTYGQHVVGAGSNSLGIASPVWKDIIGIVKAAGTGAGWPTFANFRGTSVDAYHFSVGDAVHFVFHMPHDYAPGTDIFLHAHWSHQGTAISGTMRWDYELTYAKGHNQAIFPAPVNGSISYSTVNIATTPQYIHRIDEVQISAASPASGQIATSLLEPDGLILVHFEAGAIPTITGGAVNEPFLFQVDIHYQSTLVGTLNKAPPFYA